MKATEQLRSLPPAEAGENLLSSFESIVCTRREPGPFGGENVRSNRLACRLKPMHCRLGSPMADDEQAYLRRCREQNVCPACQAPIVTKLGTGQAKDGVFCSLDCYTRWHEATLVRRHKERTKKEPPNG